MICCYTIKIVSIKIYVKVILFLGSTDHIKQSWKKRKKEKNCEKYHVLDIYYSSFHGIYWNALHV